jgi:hypothetical protein
LLELLRRLRQRVEFSRMQARGHQEVARAFGRRSSKDRRLEFEEAAVLHAAADRVDDLPALDDVGMQPVAPQIEKAVLEPDVLGIFLFAEHRHRQFVRRAQHFDIADEDLDLAGGQVNVLGAFRAAAHLAIDFHHPLGAQLLHLLERRAAGIGHHLAQPVMVAQVDEQQAAVVADAVNPAGEAHVLADVAFAERAAVVGAVAMHHGAALNWPSKTARGTNARGPRIAAQPHSAPPRVKAADSKPV